LALEGIHALIDAAGNEPQRFPPTLVYSEGWMLRLVLQWFSVREAPGHPLEFHAGATWFSEALLPSPFRSRHRGDRRAEARTHADGILGHFTIGSAAKADARLLPEAEQLVVTEAKIHSPLSGFTRNAPTYDQAARNVACIAELLSRVSRRPNELKTLAFYTSTRAVSRRSCRSRQSRRQFVCELRLSRQNSTGGLTSGSWQRSNP